jgi:hypothetical protein
MPFWSFSFRLRHQEWNQGLLSTKSWVLMMEVKEVKEDKGEMGRMMRDRKKQRWWGGSRWRKKRIREWDRWRKRRKSRSRRSSKKRRRNNRWRKKKTGRGRNKKCWSRGKWITKKLRKRLKRSKILRQLTSLRREMMRKSSRSNKKSLSSRRDQRCS